MGRSTYTPNTVSYLVVQAALNPDAGVSVGCSRSGSPRLGGHDAESKHGSLFESSTSSSRTPVVRLPSTSTGAGKYAPLAWSQRSFDPDGDDLPAVTERFLTPDEADVYEAYAEDQSQSDYGSEDSNELLEMEDEDDDDAADEIAGEDDEEQHQTATVELSPDGIPSEFVVSTEERQHLLRNVERIVAALDEAQASGDASPQLAFEREQHNIVRQALLADPQVSANSLAAAEAEDDAVFSPSSAVFHSHTLPFTLPSSDAMQMQRRASSGSPSRLR